MKTKRSMTIMFFSLMGMFLVPVSALALSEEPVSAPTFLYDPLFITVALIGCVAVCSSVIMAGVLIHMRSVGCKNASCRYHPRASKTGGAFDFSLIETPQELVVGPPEGDRAGEKTENRAENGPEEKSESSRVVQPDVVALSVFDDGSEALPSFNAQEFRRGVEGFKASEGHGFEEPEIDEPQSSATMDFTDVMILQVLTTLEHQLQTLEERQELERHQVHTLNLQRVLDRRSIFSTPEQQQPFGQQPFTQQQPFAQQRMASERAIPLEGTGQQTAIELLALAAAPRGRHFRSASSPQDVGAEMFIGNPLQHVRRPAKHARVDDSERFRRVS
jgi:hypothetical protein